MGVTLFFVINCNDQRDVKDLKDLRGSGGEDDAAARLHLPGMQGSRFANEKRLPHLTFETAFSLISLYYIIK